MNGIKGDGAVVIEVGAGDPDAVQFRAYDFYHGYYEGLKEVKATRIAALTAGCKPGQVSIPVCFCQLFLAHSGPGSSPERAPVEKSSLCGENFP